MERRLVWLILALLIVLSMILYLRRTPADRLDVDPHAAEEIERAKQR